MSQYKEIIESLREEITNLKMQLSQNQQPGLKQIVEMNQQISKVKEVIDHPAAQTNENEEEYLNSLSKELLTKYEEQYEMKKTLQELQELNLNNQILLENLQLNLKKLTEGKNDSVKEEIFKKNLNKIEVLKKNIESNEMVRRDIEHSLMENTEKQKEFMDLLAKVNSSKKQGIIELQIMVRTLKLEKIDLVAQNLEMKKTTKLIEMENRSNNKQMEEMRKELGIVKQQLKDKERELQYTKKSVKYTNEFSSRTFQEDNEFARATRKSTEKMPKNAVKHATCEKITKKIDTPPTKIATKEKINLCQSEKRNRYQNSVHSDMIKSYQSLKSNCSIESSSKKVTQNKIENNETICIKAVIRKGIDHQHEKKVKCRSPMQNPIKDPLIEPKNIHIDLKKPRLSTQANLLCSIQKEETTSKNRN